MTMPHPAEPHSRRPSALLARLSRPETLVLLLPALLKLLLHLAGARGYGLNGDELYYLACSDHLDWGYVDHPPLSILLLHFDRMLLGDSVVAIRFLPAVAGALTVVCTGLLARRLGAGLYGQLLAMICVLAAPVYLALDHMFSMNAFDVLFWSAALLVFVRILDGEHPRSWVWLGLIIGIAFENKISILFLALGLAVGILLTKKRALLMGPYPWVGAGLAVLLILPNILWQVQNDWPTLEFIRNALTKKMVHFALPEFLRQQLVLMNPFSAPVWLGGLASLFFLPALRRFRALGWCYLVVCGVIVYQGGKPYYLAPIYPVFFAAGAFAAGRWITVRWGRILLASFLIAGGVLLAPLGMPLLPVETFISYSSAIGIRHSSGELHAEGRLPDFYATMFGWERLATVVDSVYRTLPPEDRARCGIFCQNYMQAGSVDFYGRPMGLPQAICGHNSYWNWGTHGCTGEVLIVLGGNVAGWKELFAEVNERARFTDEYVQPMHNNIPIFVVRMPLQPLGPVWLRAKNFI